MKGTPFTIDEIDIQLKEKINRLNEVRAESTATYNQELEWARLNDIQDPKGYAQDIIKPQLVEINQLEGYI